MSECLLVDTGLVEKAGTGLKLVTEKAFRQAGLDSVENVLSTICLGCYRYDILKPAPIRYQGQIVAIQEVVPTHKT